MATWWKVPQARPSLCRSKTWQAAVLMIQMISTWWRDKKIRSARKCSDRYSVYGWHTALVEDGTDLKPYMLPLKKLRLMKAIFDWSQNCYWLWFSKQTRNECSTRCPSALMKLLQLPSTWLELRTALKLQQKYVRDFKENATTVASSAYDAWTLQIKEVHPELLQKWKQSSKGVIRWGDPEDFPLCGECTRNP